MRTEKAHFLRGRHSIRAALVASLLAAGLLSGCEKESKDSEKPKSAAEETEDTATAEPPATETETTDAPETADKVQVNLLEPGAEPRQVLRYSLEPGHEEKVAMTITMTMQMEMPGMPAQPIQMAPMKMIMDLAIKEKVRDDAVRYTFEISETEVLDRAGVQQPVVDAMKAELTKVVGMKGSAVVDHRGFNTDATLELPPGLDAQMKQMMESSQQSMEQMSSPLPEEAVGVGAKWEQIQKIQQNGITIEQNTVFELVELDGRKGTLKAVIVQKAPKQEAQMPNLPPGVTAEIVSLESSGTGEIHFNLDNLVPATATMDLVTNSTMNIKQGGQSQTMKMKADTHLDIEHP